MANAGNLEIVRQGADAVASWRDANPGEVLDLREADLANADLAGANLANADLVGATLEGADLRQADLCHANLNLANLGMSDLRGAQLEGATFIESWLREADLSGAKLLDVTMIGAWLEGAKLIEARFEGPSFVRPHSANLSDVTLDGADLRGACLANANLFRAHMRDATLQDTVLAGAFLLGGHLERADLSGAHCTRTNFTSTDLKQADLHGADLTEAIMIDSDLRGANLSGARVYGASVWDIQTDDETNQQGLIVTGSSQATLTTDDLELAQFLYLLLQNRKIRNVIDTITSKVVLILGRFTPDRKPVLQALRNALRESHGLVPILFDWEPSPNRDLTETVQLLANMSRFVIADVTDARSVPQELSHIIPSMPSVPIQPIVLASEREYAMFEHWRQFDSVLPEYRYVDADDLVTRVGESVLDPVTRWEQTSEKASIQQRILRDTVEAQQAEIAQLEQQLKETHPPD